VDENRLRELLVQTDAASVLPRGGDLIGGAIRRRSRRRRKAAIGGGIGVCAVIAIAGFRLMRPGVLGHRDDARVVQFENPVKPDEIAMAIQLDVATRTVDGLLRDERERAVTEHVQRLAEERFILRQEREAAARTALVAAAGLTDGDQAAVLRRIVECYAGTGAAIVARERLSTTQ
jgi:hypothetical protein